MSSPAADNVVGFVGLDRRGDPGLRCVLNDSAVAYQNINDNRGSNEMQLDSIIVQCRR